MMKRFIVMAGALLVSLGVFAGSPDGSINYTKEQRACINYATEAGNFHVSYQKFRNSDPEALSNHIETINSQSKSGRRGTVFLALSAKMKDLKPRTVKYTVSAICLKDKDFNRELDTAKLKSCESESSERMAIRCVKNSI